MMLSLPRYTTHPFHFPPWILNSKRRGTFICNWKFRKEIAEDHLWPREKYVSLCVPTLHFSWQIKDAVKVFSLHQAQPWGSDIHCGNGPFFSIFWFGFPSLHHFPLSTLDQVHFLQKPAHTSMCCRSVSRGTQKLPASRRIGLKKTKTSQAPTLWLGWIGTEGFQGQREWSQRHLHIEGQGDLVTWAQNDQEDRTTSAQRVCLTFAFSNTEPMNRTTSVEWMQLTQ